MPKRAALIVIDGWGERAEEYGNAILQAPTPVMDGFKATPNYAVIQACRDLRPHTVPPALHTPLLARHR